GTGDPHTHTHTHTQDRDWGSTHTHTHTHTQTHTHTHTHTHTPTHTHTQPHTHTPTHVKGIDEHATQHMSISVFTPLRTSVTQLVVQGSYDYTSARAGKPHNTHINTHT